MNVNFGLFPPLEGVPRGTKKRERNQLQSERGLAALEPYRVAVERLRGAA